MSTSGRMEQVLKAEHLGLDSLEGGMALNMQIAGPSSRPTSRYTFRHSRTHLSLLPKPTMLALVRISGFKLRCLVAPSSFCGSSQPFIMSGKFTKK